MLSPIVRDMLKGDGYGGLENAPGYCCCGCLVWLLFLGIVCLIGAAR
jgi:hypothetical protein